MKNFLVSAFLFFFITVTYAQNKNYYTDTEKNAIAMVNAQLEAYNSHDLEAFIALFSDSVKVYNYPNELRSSGKEELRKSFTEFFSKAPNLNSEIQNRVVMGNKVIDHEKVTGYSSNPEDILLVIAIYTVESGFISEMRFIYP